MPKRLWRDSAGFTLGETMIAMTLTIMVVTGAIEMLTRTMSVTTAARNISETNHGLQAAMSLMTRDLIQTGQGIPMGGIPLPNGGPALPVFWPGPAATLTFAAGQPTLPALSPGNGLGPSLLNVTTDIVTLLYADRTLNLSINPLTAIAANGSTMTVNAATPVTGVGGLQAGDLILFSNALGNAVQMVTTTPTTQTVTFAAGDPMRINQRTASFGSIMNLQSAPGVFPPTTVTRINMVTYFVDIVTDPTLPRLVRRVNMGNRLAIALGVENLQMTYDLVDGVTNPTNVDTPPVNNGGNQIRKANLFLLARAQEVNPSTQQFFRNSMATQVGLRSLSFMDRYR
jgi:hypothetical protein